MAKLFGSLVGTPLQTMPPRPVDSAFANGRDAVIVRDQITLAAAPAGSVISMGLMGWETVLNPAECLTWHAALGAGVTFALGDVTFPTAFANGASGSTVAGLNILANQISTVALFTPLWQMLGYASLAAAQAVGLQCEVLMTLSGGASSGLVTWQFQGAARASGGSPRTVAGLLYGALVGAPMRSNPPRPVDKAYASATDAVIVRDLITLNAAPAGSVISLGLFGWDAVLDPAGSEIFFGALGAGVTLSVGDVTYPTVFLNAVSAAAAGRFGALQSLTPNFFPPLWQQLGYASLAAALVVGPWCELRATLAGGTSSGVVSWQFAGSSRMAAGPGATPAIVAGRLYGALAGTPLRANPPRPIDKAYANGGDAMMVRDVIALASAATGTTISMGLFGWDSVIDPQESFTWTAALGAGVTFSVGDVTYPAALVNGASGAVSTTTYLLGAQFPNNFSPLWQMLGYPSLAAAQAVGQQCELLLTIGGAAASGPVNWQIMGEARM